ncbi:YraN family protein [Aquincola tertiaricarbonis]|uniref:UPF0102 protein MW290_31790 n=1 Tax=Aquincola tertiaricarbonis TaxID=391953 RepID=A0ABY4S9S4_AQUTE|nr:YraN family protein [Aquincola tertiaricarbonis]URI10118.1 YraN family protein [Aquincola tertiaricarbonis]
MADSRRWGSTRSRSTGSEGSTTATGTAGEDRALAHLRRHGLTLVERNYRVARGPSRRAGEVDLIMRDRDGTLVFVEVRSRAAASHGGAAGSVTGVKQRRVIYAAQHYLMRLSALPPCRFDVVSIEGDTLEWLVAAFDAG